GTPVGHHDLRAWGPLGASHPKSFVVGDRPEAREAEPNNERDQANPVALNTVVNGRMDGTADVDAFAFEGQAGQPVILDLAGAGRGAGPPRRGAPSARPAGGPPGPTPAPAPTRPWTCPCPRPAATWSPPTT